MTVSWLHVSDFHIRSGDPYDRDVVLRSLIEWVKQSRKNGLAPDLIFATGDIANSGKAPEYEIATSFFDKLIDAAGLQRQNLFVVPGNHDVDRDLGIGLARTLTSREEADQYFGPSVPKTHLTQKQRSFLEWYNSYFNGIRVLPEDSSCGPVTVVNVRGVTVGILPLNSALFSQRDDDHEKLWIGRRSLEVATDQLRASNAMIKVALIHHPLDWLNGFERSNIRSTLYANVDIILRGHLHETDVENVVASSGEVLHLAAGAAYQTRRWPNRALFSTIDGQLLTVIPIRYEDQPREVWTIDTSVFSTERNYKKSFLIPHLSGQGMRRRSLHVPSQGRTSFAHRRQRRYHSARNILDSIYLGDPTAEADTELLFRQGCFIETDIYKSCTELGSPVFIVGRRGTGKTALSMALSRALKPQATILCTTIVPQAHYFAHAKALARLLAKQTEVNWEFLFKSLWATTLRTEWARSLLEYYKVRVSFSDDLRILQQFIDEAAPDRHESASARLSRYMVEIAEALAGAKSDVVGLVNKLLVSYRFERVQQSLARVAEESGVSLVTIVDGLDENWDGSDTSAELISGLLIHAAADYPAVGAITFAFIRENMYRRVSNICPRWDRIEGYFYQLGWTEEQIKELILTRVASQRDFDDVTWDKVFEPAVKGLPSLNYLIGRTQFKPREIILFCKYAIDSANRHRAKKVREEDVLEGEQQYSTNRLKDLLNEYQDSFPELRFVVDLFVGKNQIETAEEFLLLLDEFISSGRYLQLAPKLSLSYPTGEGIFEVLLGVGFVGVRLHKSSPFLFKYYGEQGNVFKEIGEIQEVSIHPAFAQALGLVQGEREILIKEADENEIIAASASIAMRVSSAYESQARIVGHLRDIPPGAGAFKRYEDLMQLAIAFAFQGYLDNPRLQLKPWGGVQIRDIVFDNIGETPFFNTIRDTLGATTIPFECKNKSALEASDFHQAENFLMDTHSGIGFICYRSDRREPIGSEIRYLRDICARDGAHKRIVMLLSDANIVQLLEQRIKGKLDGFMHKMYKRYLKMYLH